MGLKSQLGITLLEVILVLAIAIALVTLSLVQYRGYQRNQDYEKLQYNVDQLFQSMRHYYLAQCLGNYDSSGALIPGTLNPANTSLAGESGSDFTDPFHVTVSDLISGGYLDSNQWQPVNNLLFTGSTLNDNSSYILQFNPTQPNPQGVTVNACTEYPTTAASGFPTMRECNAYSQTRSETNVRVLNWVSQVAVKLPNTATLSDANAMRGRLNADCVSSISSSPDKVTPCSGNPTLGSPYYLVWQRLPSYSSPQTTTNYWQSLPLIKQFNLQYTHDQMLELQGFGSTTTYYLCGG